MRLDLYSGGNDLKAETRVHRCQAVVVAVVVGVVVVAVVVVVVQT